VGGPQAARALIYTAITSLDGYINDEGSQSGDRYAKVRLEEARADCDTLSGETFVFAVAVGSKIKVQEEPGAAAYGAGEFLVVEATHVVDAQSDTAAAGTDQGFGFRVELEAVPAAVNWRPPRDTPKPVAGGPQTATVVGVTDKQIEVDEFGRVRVHFDWDRGQISDTTGASLTGGEQYWAQNVEDLEHTFKTIDQLEKSETVSRTVIEDTELFPWFIIAAVAASLFAAFVLALNPPPAP